MKVGTACFWKTQLVIFFTLRSTFLSALVADLSDYLDFLVILYLYKCLEIVPFGKNCE